MFQTLFYQPILNLLIFLYNIIPGNELALAIIALTVIIKLALYPLSKQAIKSQKALQDMQPKIEEIKKKYKDNKEEMGRKMMEFYRENKVNPFSSCLPLLLQFPFLIAVFQVFKNGFSQETLNLTYSFIERPEMINTISFGFLNLSEPSAYLAVLAGVAQFWQAKMLSAKKPEVNTEGSKDESMAAIMNKQMLYMMPALMVFIGLTLPGGLTFYWFISTVLTGIQQMIIFKKKNGDDNEKKVIEGEVVG